MKILLIVDLQNDFCPGGGLAVNEGDKIVPLVNRLIKEGGYDLVVASKDWHPAEHVSFAINHPGEALFAQVDTEHGKQVLWPVHCVQNTYGAEFHADLEVSGINKVIYKGSDPKIDSYSAFFDNGRLKETDLHAYLQDLSTKNDILRSDIEIDICGLALDFCVKATAIDAAKLGYDVSVVLDATRSVFPDNDLNNCRSMIECGIKITQSKELLPSGRNITPGLNV